MNSYDENATTVERLQWYHDYDIESGAVLYQVYTHLEECFSIDIVFE
jgi:hypothetical protein